MNPRELLHRMVEIPSVSGDERAVAEFLVESMNDMGFDAHIDSAGNAIGVIGDGPGEIVLLGHMDTVPGGPEVRIEDDILYGRGSVDAKGALATFISAAANAGADNQRIIVIGAVEEEIHTSKGARAIADEYRPDYCIIGEPSGWDAVTLGYKGRVVMEYSAEKPTAHPAADETSVAEDTIHLWNGIQSYVAEFNEDTDGIFQRLQSRIPHMATSEPENTQRMEARFTFRLPPSLEPEQLIEDLRNLPGADGAITVKESVPAYAGDRRTPLHRAFMKGIRAEGSRPRFKVKTGTSDMNVVGPVWNCPILAYGPGDSGLDHTPNEHLDLNEYERSIAVLTTVLHETAREERT
ncbi:MAG: [LysW]-lysine hydrolase [Candidatus Marinimicrobia bacterium]|nr:[LysW]-lysine hydrolase [Candidatus Neomarinimicrobiota bacterium]MCF7830019.1 [LysW]-lysine hydrolase [Candidatus Neomarinimicrobiota bacterium]MCF7881939.1 [LysW]-lysine hydrolase [Candidatus Neomarinimicrobiota bacterium]